MLWIFPEMYRFLSAVNSSRVHTWMRCFGHRLPKPSVLMSNIFQGMADDLKRKWSKKMEQQWQKMLTTKLLKIRIIRKIWQNKETMLRTALKYQRVFKAKNQKCYYRMHRSKSMNRKFVSGGRHLKESGVYTRQFCLEVIKLHDKARREELGGFNSYMGGTTHDDTLDELWQFTFAGSSSEEDWGFSKMITLDH